MIVLSSAFNKQENHCIHAANGAGPPARVHLFKEAPKLTMLSSEAFCASVGFVQRFLSPQKLTFLGRHQEKLVQSFSGKSVAGNMML
jgi:transposase